MFVETQISSLHALLAVSWLPSLDFEAWLRIFNLQTKEGIGAISPTSLPKGFEFTDKRCCAHEVLGIRSAGKK